MFNLAQHCVRPGDARAGSDLALVEYLSPQEATRWTYAELDDAVRAIAAGLLGAGLAPGQRVLLRLGNRGITPLAYLAVMAAGLVAVPTSDQLTGPEAALLAADCSAAAVLHADDLPLPTVPGCRAFGLDDVQAWSTGPARAEYAPTDAAAPAFVVYTSGTSATPKGVVHAHRSVLGRLPMRDAWQGLGPTDVLLHAGGLSWTYTLGVGLLDPWAAGATAVVYAGPRQGDVNRSGLWWQLLAASGATIFAAVPGVYRQLLTAGPPPAGLRLRHGLVAGEALAPDLWRAWREATGLPLYEALGMSEISTFVSSGPQVPTRPGSPGRPQPGRRVAVLPVDDAPGADVPLPAGELGLLAVHRSDPGLMLGYLDRPAQDAAAARGQWFVSGDLVHLDDDGYLHHHGRADDVMTAAGYRVSPVEVERVLAEHPQVADVAVTEIEVKEGVRIVTAFVVPAQPGTDPTAALLALAAERLARYKQPRQIVLVARLPRTPNGKIRRADLHRHSGSFSVPPRCPPSSASAPQA